MNKLYVYVCVSLLCYNIENFGAEQQYAQVQEEVANFKPGTFSEQIQYCANIIKLRANALYDCYKDAYKSYMGDEPKVSQSHKKTVSNSVAHPLSREHSVDVNNILPSKDRLVITTKQYLIGASIVAVAAAIIAYKCGYFSLKNNDMLSIGEVEIKKLIESVVFDPLISEQDQMHKVFEILLSNGYRNIIVYDKYTFEINGTFKVVIKDNVVNIVRI